jgi:hypothetical protein
LREDKAAWCAKQGIPIIPPVATMWNMNICHYKYAQVSPIDQGHLKPIGHGMEVNPPPFSKSNGRVQTPLAT